MKFIDPARELGADEDVEAFNIVRKVAKSPPPRVKKAMRKGQGLAAA
jgi:hypothetical protein